MPLIHTIAHAKPAEDAANAGSATGRQAAKPA